MAFQIKSHSSINSTDRLSRHPRVRTNALFGWGKDKESTQKSTDKDDQFRIQQELLAARRTGSLIKEANDRRRKVQETVAERKAARQQEKDSLAKGIIPDSLKDWKNYKTRDAEQGTSGIVIPLLPFGKKEYDEGERFDLRSPYADEGWVDPEETDMWSGLKKIGKKILNFSGNNDEYREQYGKPILWAKDYEKYKQEREAESNVKKNSKKK
ncbi:hypothetical protein CEUSTIGMA_g11807.t1 [Chlamydomonas eustigma]|uniref:Uncharacterized protein n=1 Tax=Chlamydomonas eustigma TaxID=1157962 RepID=A0A250XMR0_9CHLO|nr:hypothetical protein CEUSTIGMA_g11807.t1 [Chlamydomonas eustigma]|eukprot:GAX84385.1 hypothetical protein CEUSTIGMA_g11807.t1 [Chlamydomonas eustigma]